ncbi:MAG TPA: penicillin-binding transpeptidase domain-containing protein [Acidimicrobiales bacterium]
MSARARLLLLAVAFVAIVSAAALWLSRGDDRPDPAETAQRYLAAWQDGDAERAGEWVLDPPATFADDLAAITDGLRVEDAAYEIGDVRRDGDVALAPYTATLRLGGVGEWTYDGSLRLVWSGRDGDDAWLVDWTPAAVHPELEAGQRLVRTREWPERAPITDAADRPLADARPAVTVGIEPRRVEDLAQVKAALGEHLDVAPASVDTALGRPGVQPDHFVPIVTVAEDRYAQVREAIFPVPGLRFRDTTQRLGPDDTFARHVLGRAGEVTAELLDELGPPYQAGDIVGLSGLEARYEAQLAGTPSGEVQILDENDEMVSVVGTIEGTRPEPVRTTIDPAVQSAVEAALGDGDRPAAVAVVDSSGNVRAMASRPLDEGLNRAIGGAYPPGSTFKIITTSALLSAGVTPDTPVECAESITSGGRSFTNFESSSLGTVPFRTAFAQSCNTAFISLAADVSDADMTEAAGSFGFNIDYSVGLRTLTTRFPTPESATEHAAAAIGQGRVIATPVHMASVGAAVIDGTWEPPTLLRDADGPADGGTGDAAPEETGEDGEGTGDAGEDNGGGDPEETGEDGEGTGDAGEDNGGDTRPAPRSLPEGQAPTLRTLMRAVVTDGSGEAADVPGVEILGKTGTAEFDTGDPPPTHAWFIGVRGDLAVAVLLEGGGVGGRDAAPLAGRILAALPDS